MFAKLKKKIRDETGSTLDYDTKNGSSTQTVINSGPGLASPLTLSSPKARYESDSHDISSCSSVLLTDSPASDRLSPSTSLSNINSSEFVNISKEDALSMLIRRTEQCKKLDASNKEYSILLNSKNKEIDDLQQIVRDKEEATSTRIRELSDQAELAHANFIERIRSKNQEISDIRHHLKILEDERQIGDQPIRLNGDSGTNSDLTTTLAEQKNLVESLTKQLSDRQICLNDLTDENQRLSESLIELREGSSKEKDAKYREITQLTNEKSAEVSLRESLETDLRQASHILEDKEKQLTKLQERIGTLELRHENSALSSGEREKLLETECDKFEKKIHDLEVQRDSEKSSFYEQFTKYEQRIAEMNSLIVSLEMEKSSLTHDLQVTSNSEKQLTSRIELLEHEHSKLKTNSDEISLTSKTKISQLETENYNLSQKILNLNNEIASLNLKVLQNEPLKKSHEQLQVFQKELAHIKLNEEKLKLLSETNHKEILTITEERDDLMLRNASLSQQLATLQHQVKIKTQEVNSLQQLNGDLNVKCQGIEQKQNVFDVQSGELDSIKLSNTKLEEQIADKNKTIRNMQVRLADLKKSLQRELRVQSLPMEDSQDHRNNIYSNMGGHTSDSAKTSPTPSLSQPLATVSPVVQTPSSSSSMAKFNNKDVIKDQGRLDFSDDVNFKYLKHVVIKFILSQESEALKLVTAVSALLKLNRDEQRLLRDTLEWRMSWFGQKPDQGHKQAAKVIYPSY